MEKIKCCIEYCKENSEVIFSNLNFCKNHFFQINQFPSIKEKDKIIKRIMKKNFRIGQKQKGQILKEDRERIIGLIREGNLENPKSIDKLIKRIKRRTKKSAT